MKHFHEFGSYIIMKTILVCALLAFPVVAAHEGPKPLNPWQAGIGRFLSDASFVDSAGKPGKLSDFHSQKLTVIAITSSTCPLSKKFVPTLQAIEREFAAKNVAFLFVNPNPKDDSPENPFQGRLVKSDKLAAAVFATSTTEVIVIDPSRTVVYRGAVDDQYGLGYAWDAAKHHYLRSALTKLLAGHEPDVRATTAPGCVLDLEMPSSTTAVSYHNRISRIMNAYCVECHRTGGVGPFSLTSYDDLVANKGMIRKVVDAGTMPPWFAAKDSHGGFRNDRSMTVDDKSALLAWLKTDMPKGNDADAATARVFTEGWMIGTPDVVYALPKPVTIKATGIMPYQILSVDTKLTEDKWVQAVEVQPTNRGVVHHVIVNAIAPNSGLAARLPGGAFRVRVNEDDERSGFFAAYVPGNSFAIFPEGQAKKLAKGTVLRFQMHYTPNGTATTDQTKIGIRFANTPPAAEAKVAGIANIGIRIPPGVERHKETAKLRVPAEITLTSVVPHMHVRGAACKYELTTPDGKTTTLVEIPHYDFNWQLRYQFNEPKVVPKGSTLTFTAWYDNSTKNAANPDPSKTVRWGQQTTDEMMLGYIEYVVDLKTGTASLDEDTVHVPDGGITIPARFEKVLKVYDKDANGKLDAKEIDAMPDRLKSGVLEYIRRNQP
jgi:thiol-disulfide isomerase/thioredoxin/mono/diheme cytochrome c family protein